MTRSPIAPADTRRHRSRPGFRQARLGLGGLAVSLVVALGCAPPLQNGGVTVYAGASDRLRMLCRFGHGDGATGEACVADQLEDGTDEAPDRDQPGR